MPTGATGQLGLALPVQGELSGTWGNTVNNAITEYTNIAIAATLTLTNDGAVTLANTTGTDLATNIVSSLTGAGTVTAQFAIVRVTGTLTTAKVVTAPSYSKTYTVVNAATGGIVTFKASGQTGVSIAVGESAFVYYNGTDYVKLAGTVDTGVTTFSAGTTGFTPSTATTGAVTLAGTLATTNGGTGLTSFTSGGVVYASSSSVLATGSALTFDGSNLSTTGQVLLENNKYIGFKNTTGTYAASIFNDTSNFLNFYNSGNTGTIFYVNAAEQMRLTSTGLGIGTTSATAKLTVINTGDANKQIVFGDSATYYGSVGHNSGTGLNEYRTEPSGGHGFFIGTSGTANMTLNSSGNLGIATTTITRLLEVGSGSVTKTAIGQSLICLSANSGNVGYVNEIGFGGSGATNVQSAIGNIVTDATAASNGALYFATRSVTTDTAPSERMRITSAGDVGIGTSSPVARNHIRGSGTSGQVTASWILENASSGTAGMDITGTAGASRWRFLYGNGPSTGTNTLTESMCILTEGASAGNVGIGTSSPTTKLTLSGSSTIITLDGTTNNNARGVDFVHSGQSYGSLLNYAQTGETALTAGFTSSSGYFLTFKTENVERVRITSAGDVGIGTSSPAARLHVVTTAATITTMQSTAANGGYLTFSNGSTVPLYIGFGSTLTTGLSTSDAALRYSNNLVFSSGASEKMRIDSSGIVTMSAYGAGAATFSASGVISSVSDETWKIKDGVPVDTDAMLQKLEPCYWFYNEEKAPIFGADRQLGFFAQNVNAAIGPEAAPEPEEGKPWGYYDRSVLAVTVLSLQKALVTIESLKARLDAANL